MSSYVPVALRRAVIQRAGNCCEYCLLSQNNVFLSFEVDHIFAEKHDGETMLDNLCLSCPDCNRYKGSDIGSFDRETGLLTSFYNPRIQMWDDHFRLNGVIIEPLTDIGRVTVRLFQMNTPERREDREIYAETGQYPCKTP